MPPPNPPTAARLTFTARIVYQNAEALPAELRRGVTVPAGVEARRPTFRTLAQIVQVQQARGRRFNYANAGDLSRFAVGYTDTDLAVSFADFGRSWRSEGDFWRFCGGEIVLTCSIGVYIDERANTAARRRCLEMILTHELLHVRDEIDIVRNWLPREALQDAFIRSNLSAEARVPATNFDTRIRGTGDGRGSDLERRLQRELYIRESSDRAAALHRNRPQDMQAIGRCMGAG
jgi:hypothetical protein